MKETSKAHIRRSTNWAFVHRYFVGNGLDVGAGDDPLKAADWPNVTGVIVHDLPDGSSDRLPFENGAFDFVYASNVLEHMKDPCSALIEWERVCKPGGYIIFTVPDFDIYEQGHWPSRYNAGHRHRFSISSVIDLIRTSLVMSIKKIELIDTRYDYSLRSVDQTFPSDGAEAFIEVVLGVQ